MRMNVRVEGAREVIRAFNKLPDDAKDILRDESYQLADSLVGPVRATAAGQGRQAARAASSVKAVRDRAPKLTAGSRGGRRVKAVLFGSEFGATRRFGWYAKGRYQESSGKQYKPHRGNSSYWFFRTVDNEGDRIGSAYVTMARRVVESWSA